MEHPTDPVAKGRVFASAMLIIFCIASIYFGVAAWRWNSDFYEWVDAKPMQMTIDLTTPSTHSAPFKQTCAMAHGQSIYVAFDDPDANDENIGEHFAGLQGTVAIRDLTGAEILTKPFDASGIRLWGDDPMLVGFHPFGNGDYTAEIHIEQGAAAIGATQHDLYARNELCGLELMPAYVLGAISAVAGLIALLVATLYRRLFVMDSVFNFRATWGSYPTPPSIAIGRLEVADQPSPADRRRYVHHHSERLS